MQPGNVVVNMLGSITGRVQATARLFSDLTEGLKQRILDSPLGRAIPTRLIARVIQELVDDDATHMAAGVSYYTVLSLFPLALGLSAIVGTIIDSSGHQEEVIESIVAYLPGSESFVRDSVASAVNFRTALGIVSVVSLFLMGSAIFGAIARAVNRAWGVTRKPRFYQNKPRQLALAIVVSILFMISVGITGFLHWATSIDIAGTSLESLLGGSTVKLILQIPAVLVSFAIFITIYKVLPNTKTQWRYIWLGALVAGVLFEGSKNLFLWYLDHFARYDQVYGNIASVVVLMVWAYISAFILIVGAEVASEYGRLQTGVERGQPTEPPATSGPI